MRAQRLLGLAALGLVLAPVGCGSDSDSDTMNKQEWIIAADAVCVEMNAQLEGIPEPTTIEEFEAAQRQVEDVWRSGLADLEGLGLPEEDEAAAAEVLDAFDELVNASVEFADAIVQTGFEFMVPGTTDEMTPEVETLFRDLEAASENATLKAATYGLEHCFDDQDR